MGNTQTSYSYLPLFKISGNRRLILATNFKSGCSTMGKSIGCSSYICIDDLLKGKPVFSVTRNPFSRFMCSYLRYYLPRRNEHFKSLDDSQLTIDSYIDWLFGYRDDLGIESLDPHQRPQHYNLGIGKVPYDFVGNLERTDLVEKYLQKFGYRQLKGRTQTNAANRYKSELGKSNLSDWLISLRRILSFGSKDIDSDKISIYKEASCVRGIDQKFVLSTFLRYATVFPADGCLPHCRDKITKGLSSIFSIIVKNSSSQMSGVAGVSLPNHLIPLHLLLMPAYGQVHRFNEIIYNMLFSQLPTQDVEQNDFHATPVS